MRTHGPAAKSATAFRTISEVSTELDVPQHVLRFWETKFPQIRPLKRGGGRRYYRPEDVDLLRQIQSLLYSEGYTIKGVQRLLKEGRADPADAAALTAGDANLPGEPATAAQPAEPLPAEAVAEVSAEAESVAAPTTLSEAARREIEWALDELRAVRTLLGKRANSGE